MGAERGPALAHPGGEHVDVRGRRPGALAAGGAAASPRSGVAFGRVLHGPSGARGGGGGLGKSIGDHGGAALRTGRGTVPALAGPRTTGARLGSRTLRAVPVGLSLQRVRTGAAR